METAQPLGNLLHCWVVLMEKKVSPLIESKVTLASVFAHFSFLLPCTVLKSLGSNSSITSHRDWGCY